jgi:hypothetical protein
MNPDVLKAFLRSGVFIAGLGLLLMLATPRESAEFVVSTCSFAIGLTLTIAVVVVTRMTSR